MPRNTITLETAQSWAARWNEDQNALMGIKAFKIEGYNFKQILAQSGTVDVRTYIGINDEGNPTLMSVGVDARGNDMIDEDHLIYDFSEPCPNCCSAGNALING